MTMEDKLALWDTIPGFADDVDGWIIDARFGVRDEYAKAAAQSGVGGATPLMMIFSLYSREGEFVAEQAYSVGGGWTPEADGSAVSHSSGKVKFVKGSIYSDLIEQVTGPLDLRETLAGRGDGDPRVASTWVGLGFHWNQVEHETVGTRRGDPNAVKRSALMPTEFLGELSQEELDALLLIAGARAEGGEVASVVTAPVQRPVAPAQKAAVARAPVKPATPAARTAAVAKPAKPAAPALTATEESLKKLAKLSRDIKVFQASALNNPAVRSSPDPGILSKILDDSPEGLYAVLRTLPD